MLQFTGSQRVQLLFIKGLSSDVGQGYTMQNSKILNLTFRDILLENFKFINKFQVNSRLSAHTINFKV